MVLALTRSDRLDAADAIVDEFAVDHFDRLPRDMLCLNGLHYFSMTCEALGRDDIADDLYPLLLPHSGMVDTTATIDAGPVDLQLGAHRSRPDPLAAFMGVSSGVVPSGPDCRPPDERVRAHASEKKVRDLGRRAGGCGRPPRGLRHRRRRRRPSRGVHQCRPDRRLGLSLRG